MEINESIKESIQQVFLKKELNIKLNIIQIVLILFLFHPLIFMK